MTEHLIIFLKKPNKQLKATYRNGKLKKLDLPMLKPEFLTAIGSVLPPTLSDLERFTQQWKDKVDYQLAEKKAGSLFKEMNDAWFVFYEEFMGIKPKFTGADGKALKEIEAYLMEIHQNTSSTLEFWKIILENWKYLDKFHLKNTDLKYISTRLNVIINEIKKRTTDTGANAQDERYRL